VTLHNWTVASLRLMALLLLTGALLGPYLVAVMASGGAARRIERLWFGGCCRLAGVEPRPSGTLSAARPTLFVANHVSYLDVIALGRLLDATFVAKAEVARWPVIGFLARLARTEFVRRERLQSGRQASAIMHRLRSGQSVILFPEATSSDGGQVLPFKSALFAAADAPDPAAEIMVQPITIVYARLRGGRALGDVLRSRYAWHGDSAFAPHLWSVLGLPGVQIDVYFHEPVVAAAFSSRKALARHTEHMVATGLARARAAA
jgi:lyso-ornithine lipid O-acyltransferase